MFPSYRSLCRAVALAAVAVAVSGCARGLHQLNASSVATEHVAVAEPEANDDAGWHSESDGLLPSDPIAQVEPVGFGTTQVVEAAPEAEASYLLDAGDRVRVFVYGQPNLSRVYPIDGAGFIALPLIGEVKARALTTYDLSNSIAGLLRE